MVVVSTVSNTKKGRDGFRQRLSTQFLLHFALVFMCLACSEEEASQPPEGMALIPAGAFQMGSATGDVNEAPVHTVELDTFYIDQHEVTNAEYQVFEVLQDILSHVASVTRLSTNFSKTITKAKQKM